MATVSSTADKIAEVRKRLEKKYKDSTELFPDFSSIKEIEVIPSPSAIINAVTGVGGMPRGRVVEIYGPFSSGKTTIAIHTAVSAQKNGGVVLYVDYEHAFDAAYARALGLDLHPSRFIFSQPEYFEQGTQIIDEFLDAGVLDMAVVDSAAAMTPRSQMEGEMDTDGGSQKGTQAALMSNFLSVATKKLNKYKKPCLIIINQTRAVINIGGRPQKNAPKEQSAAGNALKFYTSMRLELEIVGKEGDSERGSKGVDQTYTQNRVRITAIKNKVAPPFIRGTLVLEYGKGINNLISIAELAEAKLGIMSGAGFFNYKGDSQSTSFACRGREAFVEYLEKNPATLAELETKVLTSIRQDHAKALGIDDIKISGKAKEIESDNPGTLVLQSPRTATQALHRSEEEDLPDPTPPKGLDGPGMPTEDTLA